MNKPKIALLIDLGSLRISCEGYQKLEADIAKTYDIASVKFYSYVAKRNRDFNEYIAAKGYDAVTPIASRRRNRLDTRQIIDATLIGMGSTIQAVGFAVGDGDILPILSFLKLKGMDVVDIDVKESPYIDAFTSHVPVLESYLREGYAAPATKRPAPKKTPKKVVAPEPKQESQYVNDVKSILAQYRKN